MKCPYYVDSNSIAVGLNCRCISEDYCPIRPKLSIVPERKPTRQEAALLRPKAMPHAPGALRCSRCGGQQWARMFSGGNINPETGKISGHTMYGPRFCANCYHNGKQIEMSVLP